MSVERENTKRTREEEVELNRNTKKVKESHNPPLRPSFGDGSLKDKLLGDILGAYTQAFSFNLQEDDRATSNVDMEDLSEGIASVRFSSNVKAHFRGKWVHTLIIKPFGRNVGFHCLHARIMSLWKPAGRLECIDLEMGFFLIRFGLVGDYDNVLKGGPWFVGDCRYSILYP